MVAEMQSELRRAGRVWQERIDRARELEERNAPAASLLRFYRSVLQFQKDLTGKSALTSRPGMSLREQIDVAFAASQFPRLLELVTESGTPLLRDTARDLQQGGEAAWRNLLGAAIEDPVFPHDTSDFFARACLQPIAEVLQSQFPSDVNYSLSVCPVCGALPQMAVLRPEGDGAQRWLLCSLCLREWLYRRVVCPACGGEDKDKLPRYSSDASSHVRVEACDTCKRYLKAVDLTHDGRAVPLVDEVALAVLDVWATEQGYGKIVLNLMGF